MKDSLVFFQARMLLLLFYLLALGLYGCRRLHMWIKNSLGKSRLVA
jgi:hypothetical protein